MKLSDDLPAGGYSIAVDGTRSFEREQFEREQSALRPPEVLTVQWCPECGRHHLLPIVGGPGHRGIGGTWCSGVPVELTYVLASEPKAKRKEK